MSTETTAAQIPATAAVARHAASPRLAVLTLVAIAGTGVSLYGAVLAGSRYLVSLPLAAVAAVWIALLGYTLQAVADETRRR